MHSERSTHRTARRLVVASAIVVVMTAVFLPGSGFGSSSGAVHGAGNAIPHGLADAIRAHFGAAPIRLASQSVDHPSMGATVALSADGTTALVSAIGVNKNGGAVYIYHVADAGSWTTSSTPAATLKVPGTRNLFGFALALSSDGTTAFIGAPFHGAGGSAFVFHVATEDAWASTSTPTATLTISHGFFTGYALAASSDGTTLVVGAPLANSFAGVAYLFHVATEDAWVSSSIPTAALTNAAEPDSDTGVGSAVAISGDGTTALVADAGSSNATGSAYIFHAASEGGWASSSSPTATLSNGSGFPGSELGFSVALSGDGTTAFLGAPTDNGGHGVVDVFNGVAEAAWVSSSTPTAVLSESASAKNGGFGNGVAVSNDGATVVVAAPGALKSRGAAYVFHAANEGAWVASTTPTATLTDSASAPNDVLGVGLGNSADGATVLLGAPGVNWSNGSADVFHVADASSWATSATPTATLTNSALPKPICVVPRLKGLPVFYAKFVLQDSNCRLGRVVRVHVKGKKVHKGRIVSQSPAPKTHLAAGAKVKVKISSK